MRHFLVPLCLGTAITLAGCTKNQDAEVERAVQDVISTDENNLNSIMMTVADPAEAVSYFKRASAEQPDKISFRRGLARSLIRAKHNTEAVAAWGKVVEHEESTNDDRVEYADALIRANDWDAAETMLNTVPPTFETFKRYRLEAMVADKNEAWTKSDSFYETAVGLTTRPASTLNNWGYSKLTRGDYQGAEKLFIEAIGYDQNLFTAKNNLVLARSAQRNYQLPVMPLTQTERAQLLHTMALSAIKQGDVAIGKGLLEEAIDTHPQHFDAASRSLKALEANVQF